jgi:copper transport protein
MLHKINLIPGARKLILAGFILLGWVGWVGVIPANAHALLLRASPPENASLPLAPTRVDLYFSEASAAGLSHVNVLDSGGKPVDRGDSRVDPSDPTHLSVSLPSLPNGVYTVIWRVLSADDGHTTSGAYPFAIGQTIPAAQIALGRSAPQSPVDLFTAITKGLLYLAAAALTGAAMFRMIIWPDRHFDKEDPAAETRFFSFYRSLVLGALTSLAVANFLGLIAQAGFGQPWPGAFLTLALDTRLGLLGIARFGFVFFLAGLLIPPPNRWNRWAGLAACLVLLLTFSLESHAAAEPRPLVPLLADCIHLTAVSIWIGGLFCFLGAVFSLRELPVSERTRRLASMLPRFSMAALICVGVLGVTGVYAAVMRVGTFADLVGTPYGQALLIKLLLFLPLLGLGAANLLHTSPEMRRLAQNEAAGADLTARFRRLLTGEVALAVLLILWVGVFTSLAPAQARSTPSGFYERTQADDLSIALNIDPGKVGINHFDATVTRNGLPVSDAQEVELLFDSYSGLVPGSKALMQNQGGGRYTFNGGYLSVVDRWSVQVAVIRPERFDAFGQFKLDLHPVQPAPVPWWRLTALILMACALAYAFSAWTLLTHRHVLWIAALAPGALVLILGFWLILQPVSPV